MNTLLNVTVAALFTAGLVTPTAPALAQAYPTKPVRIITGPPAAFGDIETMKWGRAIRIAGIKPE